jgi:spermidine/putrescine transport system ATP-binding protein
MQDMARSETPLLQLDGVSKRFGSVTVLRDVNLTVGDNEFLTVLGPSGSGKTTILRLIGGFESLDVGSIRFRGQDISRLPINRRPFNTVFQDYALFSHMSVRRNVGYGLRVRGEGKDVIRRRVDEVLATVGLDRFGDRYPAELSGGQRQRVALARAIICEPQLILLDEPLAALDVELRAQMQRFLKDLQRRLGIAFLFVTHDQEEAITLSDRIIVMRDGRIEQDGTPLAIYYRPRTRFVASFFGDNNVFEGRITAVNAESSLIETPLGPLRAGPAEDGFRSGDRVLVAIRPENIAVATTGEGTQNRIRCKVGDVQFAGPNLVVELHPEAGGPATIKMRRLSAKDCIALQPGDAVDLAWRPGDMAIIADDADHA